MSPHPSPRDFHSDPFMSAFVKAVSKRTGNLSGTLPHKNPMSTEMCG